MHRPPRRVFTLLAIGLLATACGSGPAASAVPSSSEGAGSLFDDSTVHDVTLTFDDGSFDAMLETYLATGDKPWIEATVAIDGTMYEAAGIRLKGNSSLRGSAASADPVSLPWLVDLDQFVDGQSYRGVTEFVVRSNSTTTALNEAVALELLARAGLASQASTPIRFTVNGGSAKLRLVVENPDDTWMAAALDEDGALYKAESSGDYTYRGEDPSAYDEVFDQEAGKDNADLTPLIDFLRFINESDDATFATEITKRLDVDAFATYLAMQELLDNFDDIDGPGNNSYLFYDAASGAFTVVPWDHNLAFGVRPGGGGGAPQVMPGDGVGRGGGEPPFGQGGPGGPNRSNVLVERVLAIETYAELVADDRASLRAALYDSGVAAEILAAKVAVLEAQAADLVDASTLATESQQIAAKLTT
jgi:spore coat protein CotH